jgi:hypothetical protein
MNYSNLPFFDVFMDRVEYHVDVFALLVIYKVLSQLNDWFVVDLNLSRFEL